MFLVDSIKSTFLKFHIQISLSG